MTLGQATDLIEIIVNKMTNLRQNFKTTDGALIHNLKSGELELQKYFLMNLRPMSRLKIQ